MSTVETVANRLLGTRLVDAILVLLALEGVWLAWRRRGTGRGPDARFVVSFLLAGGGLLVALRAVLAGWPAGVALVALGAAGAGNALHVLVRTTGGRDGGRVRVAPYAGAPAPDERETR